MESGRLPVEARSRWLNRLGPGVITGASDDDPSGIATYSQAGAQFGTAMLWSVLLTLPLMIAIQLVSARLGRVSGRGIVSNIRRHYSARLAYPFVLLVIVANTINVGADVAAMGESLALVVGGPSRVYAALFALLSLLLQLFLSYRKYSAYLKWLALTLLVYVLAGFVIKVDWPGAIRAAIIPQVIWSKDYFKTLLAVFGTTISPYLFVWQAASEVEEVQLDGAAQPLKEAPAQAGVHLDRIAIDTYAGMIVSAVIAFFIMILAAYALHRNGLTDIETTSQAASTTVLKNKALFAYLQVSYEESDGSLYETVRGVRVSNGPVAWAC